MNAVDGATADTERASMRRITWCTACCVMVYLLAPLAAPALLLLCAAIPLARRWAAQGRLPLNPPSAVILALALAGVYLLINASWSLSPAPAYRSVALFLTIAVCAYLLVDTLYESDRGVLRAMGVGLLVAMAAGGVILCIEAFTGLALRRLAIPNVPQLEADPRHEGVGRLAAYLLNRSIMALTLLFWPAVLVIDSLGLPSRRRLLLLAGLAPALAAIAGSGHGTSKVAFIGAAAIYGMLSLYPPLGRRMALAGWVALTLLVVPAALMLYGSQYYLAPWLPNSVQHRVVIWGYTAEQVSKAPVLGVGISSARALSATGSQDAPMAPGSAFRLSTGIHSHNAYLQVWYETGAVGAFILLGLGILVLRALAAAPLKAQPHLHAAFAASALVAASSFSIWAPWFMASLAIAALYAMLASVLACGRDHVAATPEAQSARSQSARPKHV
jgi:exopolysaccharide production protein ExoQ